MAPDLKRLPVFQPGDKVACEDGSVYTVISFLGQGGRAACTVCGALRATWR